MTGNAAINICRLGLFAAALLSYAQTTPIPKFEVAAIRRCDAASLPAAGGRGSAGGKVDWSPGRLNAECQTVDRLIRDAYFRYADGKSWPVVLPGRSVSPVSERIAQQPISGSPAWITSERYTVEAKTEGTPGEEMTRGPMMQALLEDRFQLKTHRENRQISVYELTVAASGAKLQAAREGNCIALDSSHPPQHMPAPGEAVPPPSAMLCGLFIPSPRNDGVDVNGATIANLCRSFSTLLDRDVIDKTGISGLYDIHLDIHLESRPAPDGSEPGTQSSPPAMDSSALFGSFQAAVRKLGLNLAPARVADQSLVIDHIDRPTEN